MIRRSVAMAGRFTGLRRRIATTAMYNVAVAVTAGLTGVVMARTLGPDVRGELAAVVAWSGVVVTLGQLGQAAATTYFVAQGSGRPADHLVTARNIMVCWGTLVVAAGVAGAPLLASGGDALTMAYRLVFVACLLSFVGVGYQFGLQAIDLTRWNLVRISQPVMFLAAIALLVVTDRIDLMTVAVALSVTVAAQPALAYVLCARLRLTGGRASVALARPMAQYGLGQLSASVPALIISRLDHLVLSVTVAPAVLGHYAVASSTTALAVPIVAAVGYVSFPLLASRKLSQAGTATLQRRAVLTSLALATAILCPVAILSPWLVPAVFGPSFADSVHLIWILAPGGVFFSCAQVCGHLLNGRGSPLAVARAQGVASVVTVLLLAVLVPRFGAVGAGVASTVASGIGLLLMLRSLARLSLTDGRGSTSPVDRTPADEAPRDSESFSSLMHREPPTTLGRRGG